MKTYENEKKNIPECCGKQYRSLNIKTISKEGLEIVMKACLDKLGARVAWVMHPASDGGVAHYHLAGSFMSPVRLSEALEKLCTLDKHCYIKPCRNFRASARYLAHLDSPEKVQIDPAEITLAGDWEGVNLANLFERRGASASLAQVVQYLETFMAEKGRDGFNLIEFALWLDGKGYSSQKAFSMVRSMGLDWCQLAQQAHRNLVASHRGTPNPASNAC